jgi:hypothetical protein
VKVLPYTFVNKALFSSLCLSILIHQTHFRNEIARVQKDFNFQLHEVRLLLSYLRRDRQS